MTIEMIYCHTRGGWKNKQEWQKARFCKYCGQIWEWDRRMDAAGGMEDYLRKVLI